MNVSNARKFYIVKRMKYSLEVILLNYKKELEFNRKLDVNMLLSSIGWPMEMSTDYWR
jgi:hypothetical protein